MKYVFYTLFYCLTLFAAMNIAQAQSEGKRDIIKPVQIEPPITHSETEIIRLQNQDANISTRCKPECDMKETKVVKHKKFKRKLRSKK